ncbi:unnamed protein product [Rhizophagus irregularis]|nr:unnamed protein product [Rhizophagus irregularis]
MFLLLLFFRRRLPGFGFHKGDALPGPGFQLGLLKRRPPGFEFYKAWAIKEDASWTWISAWVIKEDTFLDL